MKTASITLCWIITSISFAQTLDRQLFVVANQWIDSANIEITFNLVEKGIIICENFDKDSFTCTSSLNIRYEKFDAMKELWKLPTESIIAIQSSIDEEKYCDFLTPIRLLILENEKIYNVEWRRIQNCYPANALIVDELDKEFKIIFLLLESGAL